MTIIILCTLVISLLFVLIENTSPESPKCERRLVCGSDGQVYETSCDFERALHLSLRTLPLHECLGMMYVLMPAEHSRVLKNFTKTKIARFVGTKIGTEVGKKHVKNGKSNDMSELVNDILSVQGRDDTANLRTLCPRGRGCPDAISGKHLLPQRDFKSVGFPSRKTFALLNWFPGKEFFSTIVGGVFGKVMYVKGMILQIVKYVIIKAVEFIFYIIKSFLGLGKNGNDKINPGGNYDNNNGFDNNNYNHNHNINYNHNNNNNYNQNDNTNYNHNTNINYNHNYNNNYNHNDQNNYNHNNNNIYNHNDINNYNHYDNNNYNHYDNNNYNHYDTNNYNHYDTNNYNHYDHNHYYNNNHQITNYDHCCATNNAYCCVPSR